jgi:hypothetical protein
MPAEMKDPSRWPAQLREELGDDIGARRHTSFASLWVYPVVDDKTDVEINDKDLLIAIYRRGRPARQQDRQRRPHHPYTERHRRAAHSTTIARTPSPCCAPGSIRPNCSAARRRPTR